MNENLKRIFYSGLTNFKRNSWLSFGTTGIMVLTLFIFINLIAFNVLSQGAIRTLQDRVDVTVYFNFETNEGQILEVKDELEGLGSVRLVDYISRERALEEFKEKHKDDELIQQALLELEDNPLQASLNIKARTSNQYASIVKFLENSRFNSLIDKINFYENETAIRRVEKISSGLKLGGIFATIILALIAILVTFNTIRLTIYTQRKEIEIMRYVGASNWHISGPFLIEGALYGIYAGIVVLAIFYPTLFFVSPKITYFTGSMNLFSYFTKFFGQTLALVVGSGVLLGVVSSFIAIRKYLRI